MMTTLCLHPRARPAERKEVPVPRKVIKQLTASQPSLPFTDFHPRNKSKETNSERKPGVVYNAHRYSALSVKQLKSLRDKVRYKVQPDNCWQSITRKDAKGGVKRPRGLELDAAINQGQFAAKTAFEVCAVMLVADGKSPPSSEHEASHLCHFPACVNPKHLIWENHRENHERERCRYTRRLECHCKHKGCNAVYSLCKHSPPCIPCTCE
jgi:hypothetical protein